MDVLTTPAEMLAWADRRRTAGDRIGVVPTMGALHAGHIALVGDVAQRTDVTVVTIFVNPLQFNQPTDFDAYPRPIDDDLRTCEAAGVDAVYAPTAASMYPARFQTHVEPGALAERLEGSMRPGHFRGVTTVVTKLLGATRADVAAFGEKDFQQLAVIRRMVADLDLGVEIIGVPIVREADGLARSSRNVRLTADDRAAAVVLSVALGEARTAFDAGRRDADVLRSIVRHRIGQVEAADLEYVDVVDIDTLDTLERVEGDAAIVLAAWFGDVRLIDNIRLMPG